MLTKKEGKKKEKKQTDLMRDGEILDGLCRFFTYMDFVALLQHNILSTTMFCAFYNWFKMVFTFHSLK